MSIEESLRREADGVYGWSNFTTTVCGSGV